MRKYFRVLITGFLMSTIVCSAAAFAQQQKKGKSLTNDDFDTRPAPPTPAAPAPAAGEEKRPATDIAKPAPNPPTGATSGAIFCNSDRIGLKSSIVVLNRTEKRLIFMLFDSEISDDTVKFWTAKPGASMYPTDRRYFAKLELKLKNLTGRVNVDNIESYFFYIACPTSQLNINRSIFTDPKRMPRDFPTFEANLEPGGQVRLFAKEAEDFSLVKTTTRWEFQIQSNIHIN